MEQNLSYSAVDLAGADGHLYFFGNDEEYLLGGLRSSTCLASPVDLCGKPVAFGAGRDESLIDSDILAGDGTVGVCSLADLRVGTTQKGFTGTWRIGRGDITFASQKAAVAYRFETAATPGKAVVGTDLVAVGAGSTLKVMSCRINGAKVPSGLYGYGSGTLQVGVSGSMVIVR